MSRSRFCLRVFSAAVVTLFGFVCGGSAQTQIQPLTVTASDLSAASQEQDENIQVLPVNSPQGHATAASIKASQTAPGNSAAAPDHGPKLYPGDLQNGGGLLLSTPVVHHAIFVNTTPACPPNSCWGDPLGFMQAFFGSDLIHVTDEYTGTHADHSVGTNYSVTYPVTPGVPLQTADMRAIAYAVGQVAGAGPGNMFEIFLPTGQDDCIASTECFSPDNPSTYVYCAYHSDYLHQGVFYIYSVHPHLGVYGCEMNPVTPNGQLADDMDFRLSHEIMEAITDVRGSGWKNTLSGTLYGAEVADECLFFAPGQTGNSFDFYYLPSFVTLNGTQYAVNSIYSNAAHGCVIEPQPPGQYQ